MLNNIGGDGFLGAVHYPVKKFMIAQIKHYARLYRFFDDQRIEPNERERKRKIATEITQKSNLVISTQVINELSVNL